MPRESWTDERLDDLSRRMDQGFERVDRDIRDLRIEMGDGFREMRTLIYRFGAGLLTTMIITTLLQHWV